MTSETENASTLSELLEAAAARRPHANAFLFLSTDGAECARLDYQELWQRSRAFASSVGRSAEPGGVAVLALHTSPEAVAAFFGCVLAGLLPAMLPPPRHGRDRKAFERLARVVAETRARRVFVEDDALAAATASTLPHGCEALDVRAASATADDFTPPRISGGDPAYLQLTSGSTARPKGVVLTHENVLSNLELLKRVFGHGPELKTVSWLPLYHDMGLIGGCFATMYLGFPVVLMSPLAFLSRPSSWLRAIHRHRGTISGGPNFSYELCLRRIPEEELEGLDLSSWRFAFNGAEPVSPETMSQFEQRFARAGFRKNVLSPVYGLAECSVGLAFTPPGEPWRVDVIDREHFSTEAEAIPAKPGDPAPMKVVACGTVIPDHDMRVVDAAGLELPDRHEGQLQFRGPSATSGYYRNPEATKTLFDGEWVNTGDRAYLYQGRVYITGREKDIIIRGGRNISPYELEEAVGDLDGVRRGCVAVFGAADTAGATEKVVVLAETRERDAARHSELKTRINELAIGLIGAPVDDIVLAPPHTVPKTSSGKIRRVAAREYYERGPSAVKPQAVWLQFLRLVLAGLLPQARRGLRVVRGMLFALWAWIVCAVMFIIIFLAAAIVPGRRTWRVGQACARLLFRLCRIPLVVRGLENLPAAGPYVVASNHTSYMDAAVLLSVLPWRRSAFVAKRELGDNVLARIFFGGIGTKFVERFDVQKSAEHADELAEAARRGETLIVFPEGTLLRHTGLLPFRTGAFQTAAQAQVPVVPIALRGVRSVLRDETWYLRRYPVSVTIGAPIAPEGTDWNAAVKLRDRVRAEILKHCGEPDLAAP